MSVGIGGYANVYLEALLNSKRTDFEIVGMVDIHPESSRFFNQLSSMGVPLYSDMESFYKENSADLAIITTPIFLHTRQILCALENGSNVMCEKPMSGNSADEKIIKSASEAAGRFVMIGYQWSYSAAIQSLKSDIIKGKFGKALSMKTVVLWPRPRDYFTRGAGWAGKLNASDGTPMFDSIANNAAAHYLHNMLYLLGTETDKSAEANCVEATLFRANKIENFDTAEIKFETDCGCKCTFLGSHTTESLQDPKFEYVFENGKVVYGDEYKEITAFMNDGTTVRYGNPFSDVNEKIYIAIENTKTGEKDVLCGVTAASAQTRCIEKVQKFPIIQVPDSLISERDNFIYVNGLYEEMLLCYNENKSIRSGKIYRQVSNNAD